MMTDEEIANKIRSGYSYFSYLSQEEQQTLINVRRAEYEGTNSNTK